MALLFLFLFLFSVAERLSGKVKTLFFSAFFQRHLGVSVFQGSLTRSGFFFSCSVIMSSSASDHQRYWRCHCSCSFPVGVSSSCRPSRRFDGPSVLFVIIAV
jgi:hypothetical protein